MRPLRQRYALTDLESTSTVFRCSSAGSTSALSGTYGDPGRRAAFEPVAVAWLEWRLNGDEMQAGEMFEGPDCTLCKDPVWHIAKADMR